MTILALDLGTKMGWAVSTNIYGTAKFPAKKNEHQGERFKAFAFWLTEQKNRLGGIDAIYFEEVVNHPAKNQTRTAHLWGAWWGILEGWCARHDVPCIGVNPMTLKKFSTGTGKASKDAMREAIRLRHGINVTSDDEADALAILDWATANHQQNNKE